MTNLRLPPACIEVGIETSHACQEPAFVDDFFTQLQNDGLGLYTDAIHSLSYEIAKRRDLTPQQRLRVMACAMLSLVSTATTIGDLYESWEAPIDPTVIPIQESL